MTETQHHAHNEIKKHLVLTDKEKLIGFLLLIVILFVNVYGVASINSQLNSLAAVNQDNTNTGGNNTGGNNTGGNNTGGNNQGGNNQGGNNTGGNNTGGTNTGGNAMGDPCGAMWSANSGIGMTNTGGNNTGGNNTGGNNTGGNNTGGNNTGGNNTGGNNTGGNNTGGNNTGGNNTGGNNTGGNNTGGNNTGGNNQGGNNQGGNNTGGNNNSMNGMGMNNLPCVSAIGFLTNNDYLNYVLGYSKGGKADRSANQNSRDMQPNSRFANAGKNEFRAAAAAAYADEFKAYAMNMHIIYLHKKDTPQQIANNLSFATQTPFVPEAEIFGEVAAIYKGSTFGNGNYNNGKLKNLLKSWGRTDLTKGTGVGNTDVETIAAVVRALNEQPSSDIRASWLAQIYTINQNIPNGTSPSGAVQNPDKYKKALALVNSGMYAHLLQNFAMGVRTNNKLQPDPNAALQGYIPFACMGSCPSQAPVVSSTGTTGTTNTGNAGGYMYAPQSFYQQLLGLLQQLMAMLQHLMGK